MNAETQNVEGLVEKIKADDNTLTLSGVKYKFQRFRHKERVKVFGFMTSIAPALERGNFDFLSSETFEKVESIIANNVTVNGVQLAKLVDHWEENESNYIPFVTVALQFISYPLLSGDLTS